MGRIIAKKVRGMSWMAKISLVLILTLVLSTFMHQGLSTPKKVEAAVTFQSAGAIAYSASGGTTVAPAYPTPLATGDLLVLIVGMKPSTANGGSVTTPTGWIPIATLTGAGGYGTTLAADTGNTNLFAYYHVSDGTEIGTLTVTLAANNVSWAQIYRVSKTLADWSVVGATGSDTTGDATVSIPFSSNPGVTAGDFILAAMSIPTDVTTPAQFSAEAFSQTGVTFGAVTEIIEPDSATGNQIGGFVVRAAVTAGTSTASPTMTATAGGTTTNVRGPGVFIRIREVAAKQPSTITSCAGCHPYSPTFPDGTARDVPPGQFPGSHQRHVQNSGYACSACHVVPTTETAADFEHRDGIIQMVAAAGTYSKGLSFAQSNTAPFTGGTCSTATCHANVYSTGSVTTPAWGTAAGCAACHTAPYAIAATGPNTGSHAQHNDPVCTNCHNAGTTATTAPSTGHIDGNIDVTGGYPANVAKHAAGTYTGTCTTTLCHGSASPVWGANTTATSSCQKCHAAANTGLSTRHDRHYNSTTPPTALTAADAHTATAYVYGCSNCHPTNQHMTGVVGTLQAAQVAGTRISAYTAGTTSAADARGFNYTTTGTCTSVCHTRDGVSGAAVVAVNWGTAPVTGTTCGICHNKAGDAAPVWTAPHTKHINTYSLNANITCNACHATTATDNATINGATGRAQHPNASRNVAMNTFSGGTVSGAQGAQQCSNTYCHSQGTVLTGASTHAALSWSGTTTCSSCHTGGTTTGPSYGSGSPKPNSHVAHTTTGGYACVDCHSTVVDATNTITSPANHVNKIYNVAGATITAYTYNATGSTCTTSCHGGATATWGGTATCQSCHLTTAADVNDFTGTFYNNGTVSTVNSTEWTTRGHGSTTAYASGNPAAGFTVTNACTYCHDSTVAHKVATNPFRLRNFADATWGKNGNCQSCHATGSAGVTIDGVLKNSTSKVGSYHYGAKHSTTASGGQFCWDCHDPHGDSNAFMMQALVAKTSDATTGAPTATVATTFTAFATGTDYAKSAAPFNGICNVCHTTAGHYTSTAGDGHNSTSKCTSCHSHSGTTNVNGFTPTGGGSCIGCHASPQGTRSAIVPEFGLAWGHKKAGRGAVTDGDCIVCHLEGKYDAAVGSTISTTTYHMNGNIDLRDPDGTGETPITNMTGGAFTFTKFATSYAAGSRTSTYHTSNNVDNVLTQKFCLACHDSNGATNPTARSSTSSTAAMPFGGVALGTGYTAANDAIGTQGLVDVKKQFALTNSSRHPVLGPRVKDFPYSTRLAAPYNNIGTARDANGTTGHATASSVVITCFDCHTTSALPTTRTIVSHGDASTVRGTTYVASPTLCLACHIGTYGGSTQNHGTGSAWAATGSSHGTSVLPNCHYCHGSNTNATKPARPRPAQDYHGSNALASGGLWPTVNSRPYAFIRGWTGTAYHRPYRASEFTTGSATCGAGTCPGGGQVGDGSNRTYTPGGTY